MTQFIRTITLGTMIDPDAPDRSMPAISRFIDHTRDHLTAQGLSARTLRVTCQSADALYRAPDAPGRARRFAETMEGMLADRAWFCLPGPQYRDDSIPAAALDSVAEVVAATRNVFTNTLVSSPRGVHRGAIRRAGEVIAALARADARNQANFRFAVMANVRPNTPYFPASYHEGPDGFSIALELSALMNEAFEVGGTIAAKLEAFRARVTHHLQTVTAFATSLTQETGLHFKGVDFSLAPFPGDGTSAAAAVEKLNNTRVGAYDFVFSLYAVNTMLKRGFAGCPQVGYNGTMLSVLEDSRLARRLRDKAFSIKDLLLYAGVCGCGLDMIPLHLDTTPAQLASLIEPVATQAIKWDKPLIARLLPSAVGADGLTRFEHDFIVNTTPICLDGEYFADQTDLDSFFTPDDLGLAAEAA